MSTGRCFRQFHTVLARFHLKTSTQQSIALKQQSTKCSRSSSSDRNSSLENINNIHASVLCLHRAIYPRGFHKKTRIWRGAWTHPSKRAGIFPQPGKQPIKHSFLILVSFTSKNFPLSFHGSSSLSITFLPVRLNILPNSLA